MLHYFDFPRLLVCYLGVNLELKKLYFIFVAICGGSITIFPGLLDKFIVIRMKYYSPCTHTHMANIHVQTLNNGGGK